MRQTKTAEKRHGKFIAHEKLFIFQKFSKILKLAENIIWLEKMVKHKKQVRVCLTDISVRNFTPLFHFRLFFRTFMACVKLSKNEGLPIKAIDLEIQIYP